MENNTQPAKKKWSIGKKAGVIAGCVLLAAALLVGAVYLYFDLSLTEGDSGSLTDDIQGTASENAKDVEYILVCGIDDDEEDESRSGVGRTDMILLACYDRKAGQLSILQIPRDTYVGEEVSTGGTGRSTPCTAMDRILKTVSPIWQG